MTQTDETKSDYDVNVARARAMLRDRESLPPIQFLEDFVLPLMDELREECLALVAAADERVEERLEVLNLPEHDLGERAFKIIVEILGTALDLAFVRAGWVRDGKYTAALPPDLRELYERAQAEVRLWCADYARAQEAQGEEQEGDDGDDEDEGDDGEAQVAAGTQEVRS